LQGTMFRDFNGDSSRNASTEPGVTGALVTAVCIADTGAAAGSIDDVYAAPVTTTTAVDGRFSFGAALAAPAAWDAIANGPWSPPTPGPLLNAAACRIEFSLPASPASILPAASAESMVQFVDLTSTDVSGVDVGVHNPAQYSPSTTPDLIGGAVTGFDVATSPSLRSIMQFAYGSTGSAFSMTSANSTTMHTNEIAKHGDLGSVWGMAYSPSRNRVYTSSLLRRHAAVGPSGIDAIRQYVPGGVVTDLTTGIDTDGGTVQSNSTRGFSNLVTALPDSTAFDQVGKVGWGDIDMSEDDRFLWAVNLYDHTLYKINLDSGATAASYLMPDPGCSRGTARPWGLGVHDGMVYAGVVCNADATGASAGRPQDLTAQVYPLNVASGVWGANVLDGDPATAGVQPLLLNYAKGCGTSSSVLLNCGWFPWASTDANYVYTTPFPSLPNIRMPSNASAPILSDIAFDNDGSIVLSFLDRAGFQFSAQNVGIDPTDTHAYQHYISGDLLRASPAVAGTTFIIEQGGQAPSGPSLPIARSGGIANNQGPAGGEFYSYDNFVFPTGPPAGHQETAEGSSVIVPGSSLVASMVMDPSTFDSGGVAWSSNLDGTRDHAVEFLAGNAPPLFGKANSLTDLEALTQVAPIEIGNRIWSDENRNGIQDPGEPPVPGLTVTLYAADETTVLATVVTDAMGSYRFSSAAGTDALGINYGIAELVPGAQVIVGAPTSAIIGGVSTPLTSQKNGANSSIDSDVSTTTGRTALITMGGPGANNHTFDIGYAPISPLAVGDFVWYDLDRNGVQDAGESPVVSATVELLVDDGTGTFVPASHIGGSVVAATTTDANGRYVFDNLPSGTYIVRFTHGKDGYRWTTANDGTTTDAADSDAVATVNTSASAQTLPFVLSIGQSNIAPVNASDVAELGPLVALHIDRTRDAGVWLPFAVGDYTWIDTNSNGLQDAGEPALPGVTVELLNPDGTPANDADGNPVGTVVTDSNGHYLFDNLPPGSYKVRFSNLPPKWEFTAQGTADTASDSNPDVTGLTPVFTLGPTSPNMRQGTSADGTTHFINPTIDGGIVRSVVTAVHLPATGTASEAVVQFALYFIVFGLAMIVVHRRRYRG
jgi:hypothetical protein